MLSSDICAQIFFMWTMNFGNWRQATVVVHADRFRLQREEMLFRKHSLMHAAVGGAEKTLIQTACSILYK